MDNEREDASEGDVRQRSARHSGDTDGSQGLQARLNGELVKNPDSEETPLLGHGSGSASGERGNTTQETTWDRQADFDGLTWWHTPSVFWLIPGFFLFALAFGGILVPRLNLILALVCREYLVEQSRADPTFTFVPVLMGSDNDQCQSAPVQALVAKFVLYITVVSGSLSAIMAPKLGALSDRYGRLRILALTSIGTLLSEVVTIVAATFPESVHYQWLFAGAVMDGLCGSFTTGMAITHAYATDSTPPATRAAAFGYFHGCLFGGIALGPLFAALLFKATKSLLSVFYIALGVHCFFILYIFILVPESLSKNRQLLAREKHAAKGESLRWEGNNWLRTINRGNILAPLSILWPTGPGTRDLRTNLILLATVDTIIFGVAMGSMTVVIYYTGFQFGWKTDDSSLFVSIVNSFRVATLIVLLPLGTYFFRTRRDRKRRESGQEVLERHSGTDFIDLSIIRLAVAFDTLGYLGYALARTGPLFTASGVLTAFGGIGSPTLQSAMTKHVPHDKVGQLLGATGLLHALARIVFPVVFNLMYAATVATVPQTVFLVLSACFLVGFLFSWFIRPSVYVEELDTSAGADRIEVDNDVLVDEEIAGI